MSEHSIGRRSFLGWIAGATAAAGLASTISVGAEEVDNLIGRPGRDDPHDPAQLHLSIHRPPSAAVLELLGDVRAGAMLAGSTVVSVHDLRMGTVPVVARNPSGRLFQIDIMARGNHGGVASNESHELFLVHGREGVASEESEARAAVELARRLAPSAACTRVALLTRAERTARFPRGAFAVAV